MTRTAHPLVTDYLASIEREASFLSAGRREELLADLREHLDVAVGDERDPAAVRAALERLGSPAAIVAAARAEEPEAAAAPRPGGGTRNRTTPTAVLLGVSGVLTVLSPFVGLAALLVGLGLLWTSDVWTQGAKTSATVLAALPPLLIFVGLLLGGGRVGPAEILVALVLGLVLPLVAAVRLVRAARRAV